MSPTKLMQESGKVAYRERLGGTGTAFASPIASDGKIYLCTPEGVVAVLAAGGKPKALLALT